MIKESELTIATSTAFWLEGDWSQRMERVWSLARVRVIGRYVSSVQTPSAVEPC